MVQEVSSAVENTSQETDRPEKRCKNTNSNSSCYTNTSSNSNINSSNAFMPIVNNNEIEYFLPDPDQENDQRASNEITQQLQRDFEDVCTGIGWFHWTFSLQVKPWQQTVPSIPKTCSPYTTKTCQRGVRMTAATRHHKTSRHWWNSGMVQQLCPCTKT